ncbi:MAG: translation initiation factor IF-2 N-terminal domain-containing protein, partial [Proteobacteria bacterium]|nr:translation initiation factor IF-2 N-terminal domain-containing protein [Pseudomonadota bacterium]
MSFDKRRSLTQEGLRESMAKSTKVLDLAATLNMDGQQLIDQINALGLGFSVKSKSSALTDEQVRQIQQSLASQRQSRGNSAIDAKSQSTGKGTVRIRRRRDDDTSSEKPAAKPEAKKADDSAKPQDKKPAEAAKKPETKAAPAEVKAEVKPAPESKDT